MLTVIPDLLLRVMISWSPILPGAGAQIISILPFNQTVTIQVSAEPITLGFAAARFIFVERMASQV